MVESRSRAIRRLGILAIAAFVLAACTRSGTESTAATSSSTSSATETTTETTTSSSDTKASTATADAAASDTAGNDSTTTDAVTDGTTSTTVVSGATSTTTGSEPGAHPHVADPVTRPALVVSNMNRDSVDDFDPTGDDVYRAVIELADLFNYLEGSPTGTAEEMAGLMYEPDYANWDGVVANYEELTSNPGWHYTDAGIRVLAVEVLEFSGDTTTIRRVHERTTQIISDANDVIVEERPGWAPTLTVITYHRGEDGRWRYADLVSSEPATDEDIATMVPVAWTRREP